MRFLFAGWLALQGLIVLASAAEAVPYGDNPAAGRYYEIRGFRMYCEIYGSGKPLLLIHGNGGTIKSFAKTIPYFATKYQVIVPEGRSHGKSRDPGEALTFEMMADDLSALLDTLKVESVFALGWSDGGINALLLAMRHPEKVARLASTGANLWPDATAFAPGVWEQSVKEYAEKKDKPRVTEKEKDAWKRFMLDYSEPHIALTDLKAIKCPALIIAGDHDVIALDHTVAIFRNIPQAALWVMPLTGHGTVVTRAEEFNQRVDEFFTRPFAVKK